MRFRGCSSAAGAPEGRGAGLFSTAALDLEDTHGNTGDGLHTASLGGAFLAMLKGFAGVRVENGQLMADPVLPAGLKGYEMKLTFRGIKYLLQIRENSGWTLEKVNKQENE